MHTKKLIFNFPPDCYNDDAVNGLEAEQILHDYVLLTPGGKYVPLVKTRSGSNERAVFTECCTDTNRPQQRVPEVFETGL